MSTDWYEHPYKGGPMVPVPGFPRVLKLGSDKGPDVEAYKRTVWRAGRWPGPATSFDRAFSRAFSLGQGPNVIDTGLAGVQRQQNMLADGVVDQHTFNTLRSIRVPPGRPHENEMCMDANAQNLIAEAYARFHPPPALAAVGTVAERALAGATSYLGYKESPPGSNNTTFGSWYGANMNYQPWCAIFVTYCYEVEAGGSPSFARGSQYAYVPYIVSDARAKRNGLTVTTSPHAGDLVCFDWAYDGTYDHIGLFEKWTTIDTTTFQAIEGNTSTSDQSNGGEVQRRTRSTSSQATVFVRVAEP